MIYWQQSHRLVKFPVKPAQRKVKMKNARIANNYRKMMNLAKDGMNNWLELSKKHLRKGNKDLAVTYIKRYWWWNRYYKRLCEMEAKS